MVAPIEPFEHGTRGTMAVAAVQADTDVISAGEVEAGLDVNAQRGLVQQFLSTNGAPGGGSTPRYTPDATR